MCVCVHQISVMYKWVIDPYNLVCGTHSDNVIVPGYTCLQLKGERKPSLSLTHTHSRFDIAVRTSN